MSPSLLRSGPPGDTAASLRFAGIFAARFSPKNSLTLQERACWRLVGFFEGSPCAKQASLPPGPARCALSCAKSPSLPPGAARCGLPCAKRAFLPPGPAICGLPCAKRAFLPPGPARCCLPCAKRAFLPPGPARCCLPCAKRAFLPPGPSRCGLPCANRAFLPPGRGSLAFCREAASRGRDSVRCAHPGPSQRLQRPRCARTCIRRAPPPARVRGWTRPPAAASRRLPVCKTGLPAPGARVIIPAVCKKPLPAPGTGRKPG